MHTMMTSPEMTHQQSHEITAAVIALESRAEQFGITVELVPPARTGLPGPTCPTSRT
jgi:hypothetical protein